MVFPRLRFSIIKNSMYKYSIMANVYINGMIMIVSDELIPKSNVFSCIKLRDVTSYVILNPQDYYARLFSSG